MKRSIIVLVIYIKKIFIMENLANETFTNSYMVAHRCQSKKFLKIKFKKFKK